jgi:asparagine synthase (glutamine-hydrolysing)
MCEAIEHRGPDSRGMHVEGGIGLGVQRLRIIDLHTGDQPLYNEDRTIAVVLNGEIYNFRELRERLIASGHRFTSRTDTEVLVHLYEEHGTDFVRHLHGMFAFALWDEPRRRLMLGRDRIGKKPLFYAQVPGGLSFASELNSLMRDPAIPRELDPRALDAYLALRYIPHPFSVYKAVRKLPPASILVHEGGEPRIERYWRLDYAKKRTFSSEEELHHEIRESIRAATRRRLISDVPLGAFISGGIDSSAVVAAMAEFTSEPIKTFSIGFETTEIAFDELPYARRIARQFATDHEEYVVRPQAIEMIPAIVQRYGEPFGDPTAIPSFYLSELARRHVTVALNGDGGDENFAGYQRYVANALLHRFDPLPASFRRRIAELGRALPTSPRINSSLSRLRRLASGLGAEPDERYLAYITYLDGLDRRALYTSEFEELVGPPAVTDIVLGHWEASSATELVDRLLDVDVNVYLAGDLLPKMDIATMSYSLEARSPLLDHEFMELAASIPAGLKVAGSQKKFALREALRGWIPDEILDRPKQGFELPIADWLRTELRDFAYDVLLDPAARERGFFRTDYVKSLLDRHVGREVDNAGRIWTLLIFELWYDGVVSGRHTSGDGACTAPLELTPSSVRS